VYLNVDSHKVGLEAAIFLRKRNSSLIEFICLKNLYRLLKLISELRNLF